MVKSYLNHSTGFQDLVAGKGDGLVVLLHGPPGVGKTLTAAYKECVAESFKKPLYMVTAGDLGTDPETLESKLSKIFDYAVAWDAILLLDEADIFLQDRDYDNLQRNALVSIFLRTLEYFNGIMFLTSNRVGAFDQAFQSRIHITIGMPEFDEALRKEVWKIFIKDLGRNRRDGSPALLSHDECRALGSEVVTSWASQPLNGRQIRNCVRSALALAENKGLKPNASHFNNVIKLGNAFTQYMNKLQKAEAEEIAQIKGDRLAAMKDLMAQDNAM
ncbi:ATPase family AAA domain-containing protein 3 [Colletotrichum spaethianum]|uniref:ATPase family AAA domain-containing protein 3 n=1 Tax=Colletotrichum spaethianum TaxID=700344 RepID=A0AA37LIL4_9PEZI|nr:ATPase family AAA domain-containing protein 3 [Colletotrichum spaethianum]GKT47250.1 ATPase family AAA domain-containing protein 3 [Colletotrichum spaethianum]